MTQGQINVQQVITQAVTGVLTVSIMANALGMLLAASEGLPIGTQIAATSKGIDDLKSAYGQGVVSKAVSEVGSDDIMLLAARVDELYVDSMVKKYGTWATEQGLATAPAGDVRAANEIAAVLANRGVTPASTPEKKERAVTEGKRRGRRVAQPVKDTNTGIVYQSKAKAGMAVAAEYGLDSKNHFVWYEVIKQSPKRFVKV